MRRVFETRFFGRWARKSGLSDRALCRALQEMASGLIDADLGGGLVKKRIQLAGRGKRRGARTATQLDEAVADGALQDICHGDQAKIEEPDTRCCS
ncbi:MAG TPA: type II toxin-antitoxin system RelE/ParE family toxin [Zeimonas sp.]|nr:type II toxin-antitoxin system RelE/ParE family toxin [Zeimonas sp.]